MNDGFAVSRACTGEGAAIARLIACSLPPLLRPLTIWGSPRAGSYLEAIIEGRLPEQQAGFYLLRCAGEPVGVAALRMLEGRAFLNHLYVARQLRGRSLGSWLFGEALERYLADHPAPAVA